MKGFLYFQFLCRVLTLKFGRLPDKHDEFSDHLEYVGQGQVGYVGVRGVSLSDTPADRWKYAEGGLRKK